MYKNLTRLILGAECAVKDSVDRYGISVYVDTDPDDIAPDIYIHPADEKGLAIFREFAAKMAAHYKTLKK